MWLALAEGSQIYCVVHQQGKVNYCYCMLLHIQYTSKKNFSCPFCLTDCFTSLLTHGRIHSTFAVHVYTLFLAVKQRVQIRTMLLMNNRTAQDQGTCVHFICVRVSTLGHSVVCAVLISHVLYTCMYIYICRPRSHIMKASDITTYIVPTTAMPILLTQHSIFLVHQHTS